MAFLIKGNVASRGRPLAGLESKRGDSGGLAHSALRRKEVGHANSSVEWERNLNSARSNKF